MDPASQLTVKRKFDIVFVIAKQHLPFTKMKVELGQGYKNNQACATFVKYIALEQLQADDNTPISLEDWEDWLESD